VDWIQFKFFSSRYGLAVTTRRAASCTPTGPPAPAARTRCCTRGRVTPRRSTFRTALGSRLEERPQGVLLLCFSTIFRGNFPIIFCRKLKLSFFEKFSSENLHFKSTYCLVPTYMNKYSSVCTYDLFLMAEITLTNVGVIGVM
jgi:hypothetical protein